MEQRDPSDYRIGWICALPLEFTAAVAVLDAVHPDLPHHENDTNAYRFGQVGQQNVIITGLPSGVYGLTSAARVATNLRRSFPSVNYCLVVGIGGGAPLLPKNDIRLGDVVVSHPIPGCGGVLQYDYGKLVNTGKFEQTGVLNKPPDIFLSAITKFKSAYPPPGKKIEEFVSRVLNSGSVDTKIFSRPSPESHCDRLFKESYEHLSGDKTCNHCGLDMVVERPPRSSNQPEIHYGLIASANQVMKHGATRSRLSEERNILCFEMEAAGVMDQIPSLIIRGICDYSDSHKNKAWQHYAALVAAGYARELLLQIGSPQTSKKRKDREGNSIKTKDIFGCLEALGGTNPTDDKSRIENLKDKPVDDSISWILNDKNFKQWLTIKDKPILRISGDPGKGKTMIMISLIDHMTEMFHQDTGSKVAISYFFCQATDSRLNNALAVMKGLLSQLISNPRYPSLVRYLKSEVDMRGKNCFEDPNAFYALERILLNICADPEYNTFYFIVDALDECIGDLDRLLKLICSTCTKASRIRWLVTSRNRPEIEAEFEYAELQLQISLEEHAEQINMTVNAYIDSKLQELSIKRRYHPDIQERVGQLLREKAGGTFLWVHLACKELKSVYSYNAVATLSDLPSGLNGFYGEMLKHLDRSGYNNDVELCSQILSAMVVAFRPLSLQEMVTIAELPSEMNEIDIEVQVKSCGSFLTIQNRIVSFVHQSAKDFLDNNIGSRLIIPNGLGYQHQEIFTRSMRQLEKELKADICSLNCLDFAVKDLRAEHRDMIDHLRYACYYWVDHLALADPPMANEELVLRFLEKHLLHWMELMIVLDPTFEIVTMVKWLRTTMEAQGVSNGYLKALLYDLQRFSQYHKAVLCNTPLQLYSSCLVFSPENSMIKSLFRSMVPKCIQQTYSLKKEWGSVVQIFQPPNEGTFFDADIIALSSDDKILAIGLRRDTYNFILWDLSSGAILQRLSVPDQNVARWLSLKFSPDNQMVVVVAELRRMQEQGNPTAALSNPRVSIGVWNVASGEYMYNWEIPKVPRPQETSIVWIPGSTPKLVFASALKDLWLLHTNRETGPVSDQFYQAAPGEYDRHVWRDIKLAFDVFSDQVVSGARGYRSILLWSMGSRVLSREFNLTREPSFQIYQGLKEISLIHFATSHQLLVATYYGFWKLNLDSGCIEGIVEFDPPPREPQLLQDGMWLAFNPSRYRSQDDESESFEIYDVHSGKHLRQLRLDIPEQLSGYTCSILLNSKMTQCFTAHSEAIRILEISPKDAPHEVQLASLDDMAASPNGRYLAVCQVGFITLWDYESISPPQTWDAIGDEARRQLQGRGIFIMGSGYNVDQEVTELDFSPDNNLLVFRTNRIIKFWDIKSRSLLGTLDDWYDCLYRVPVAGLEVNRLNQEVGTNSPDIKSGFRDHLYGSDSVWCKGFSFTGKLAFMPGMSNDRLVHLRTFDPSLTVKTTRPLVSFRTEYASLNPYPFTNDTFYTDIKFSPDGSLLVMESYGIVTLWDTTSGQKLCTFGRENCGDTDYIPDRTLTSFCSNGQKLIVALHSERSLRFTIYSLGSLKNAPVMGLPHTQIWSSDLLLPQNLVAPQLSLTIDPLSLISTGGWFQFPSMTPILQLDDWLWYQGERILHLPFKADRVSVIASYRDLCFVGTASGVMMVVRAPYKYMEQALMEESFLEMSLQSSSRIDTNPDQMS
ncbi:hypothetical protein TWF788_007706 [Orbilia oligospora]|uniref:NACHT domain-containing protein n=1 Tax=Orbilia oligospora TaxID=2813651 RepID=A0A7C8TR09_ORBOL|nr:hypothetical protein TWF788_007706 [Orbilia oligospora]